MNILLTPDLENLVNEKLKSGEYNSPSEVIREALSLLNEKDQIKEIRREELRQEILKGVEDIRAGRYTTLETEDDFDKFAARVARNGQELLEKSKG